MIMEAPESADFSTRAPQPLVSVLIPTYRYARYLSEAIESVLSQDLRDFELIIADDASNDGTAEIIRRYALHDSRIRVHVHPKNIGMVANWNWCLQQARGRYVKFLFGDDRLVTAHALSTLVNLLERCPSSTVAASSRLQIDEHSRVTGLSNDLVRAGFYDGRMTVLRCLFGNHNFIGEPSAVMFRRNVTTRGFDARFSHLVDLEMWLHLLLRGNLVYTPEPLCAFRHHDAQQSAVNRHNLSGDLDMGRIVLDYLGAPELRALSRKYPVAFRQTRYRAAYYLAKAARRLTAEGFRDTSAAFQVAHQVRGTLPKHWLALCWCRHHFTRPIENVQRSLRKRLNRQTAMRVPNPFAPVAAPQPLLRKVA